MKDRDGSFLVTTREVKGRMWEPTQNFLVLPAPGGRAIFDLVCFSQHVKGSLTEFSGSGTR